LADDGPGELGGVDRVVLEVCAGVGVGQEL
jgi:hypothetical protein